jgi:hypothetical protein
LIKNKCIKCAGFSSLLLEEKGGGMRCFHNYPTFVKIKPCRGVVDYYKVRDKIGAFD